MLSFWEKEHLLKSDVLVVGAGITGLSTACAIKEKHPALRVRVIERGVFPTGASTKNAGFACIGSLTEKQYDLRLMGEQQLLRLLSDRWEGLRILRERLGDTAIDYHNFGGYELLMDDRVVHADELDEMNRLLKPVFGRDVFGFRNDRIPVFGFDKTRQLIFNELEGQINTGLMMRSLWNYAGSLGIEVMTGTEAEHIEQLSDGVEVALANPEIRFWASKVFICTNAFTSTFLPDEEINPGRGQVLITTPVNGLPFKGIFNFDEGFYYFRNLGDRVILGGGRNLDFKQEETTAFALNPQIQQKLELMLREVILPGKTFEITDRWSGIMAFGSSKLPLVKQVTKDIAVGARLNGMGIALGSKIAENLSGYL